MCVLEGWGRGGGGSRREVQTEEQQDGGCGQDAVAVMRVKGHVLLLPPQMIPADSTWAPSMIPNQQQVAQIPETSHH